MDKLSIERVGGLAGFGPGSRLRSRGEVDMGSLDEADRATVARLFAGGEQTAPAHPDGFRYRLTRAGGGDGAPPQTIEVAEAAVPPAIRSSVRDVLA